MTDGIEMCSYHLMVIIYFPNQFSLKYSATNQICMKQASYLIMDVSDNEFGRDTHNLSEERASQQRNLSPIKYLPFEFHLRPQQTHKSYREIQLPGNKPLGWICQFAFISSSPAEALCESAKYFLSLLLIMSWCLDYSSSTRWHQAGVPWTSPLLISPEAAVEL